MARWSRSVDDALTEASRRYGVPYSVLRSIAQVESAGNPNARTGSYHGLFQLSDAEFRRMRGGEGGDILSARDNAMAGAALLASHQQAFERRFGRAPSLNELYMIHQQGWGGMQAHMANPDQPAWMNMASTAEGRARGEEWAKRAIAGNIPPRLLQGRDPNTITSREFMDIWNRRLNGEANPPTAAEGVDAQLGQDLRVPAAGIRQPEAPAQRAPAEEPEKGFFDHRYPLANAITGQDAPILSSIFGEAGLGQNRTASNIGAALSSIGSALAKPTPSMPAQVSLPGATPALPGQDDRAFALQPMQRRRFGSA